MATKLEQNQFLLSGTILSLFLVILGIFTRIIAHVPNFTPEIVFALYLGIQFKRMRAILFILFMAIISDFMLSWYSAYPMFGVWTFFTYSALVMIALCGMISILRCSKIAFLLGGLLVTVGFWGWTNFGVWLFSKMYAHTLTGLLECYTLALPFLNTALAGSLVWGIIVIAYEYGLASLNIRQLNILWAN